MKKTIDLRRHEIMRGGALRHADAVFESDALHYDPERPAGLCDLILGEIDDPVVVGAVDAREDGLEGITARDEHLVFAMRPFRPGLIAIPVGNRYAPLGITGGLQNPIDLVPNGEIVGGTKITNLACGNLAGFVNMRWPDDRPLTHIRVLGGIVDPTGRPVSSRDFVPPRSREVQHTPYGILVGGAGMESGKTTLCCALFAALRASGEHVTYAKTTGTACFLSDPLRVQLGDPNIHAVWGREIVLAADDLRVGDFVDACGVPSDASVDLATFTEGTCRFIRHEAGEVHIAELADSLHHRTNLGLLKSREFRSHFRGMVYVVDPSLDAARNALFFLQEGLGWRDVHLAFAGPLATEPVHTALRAEIQVRFGIPCIDPADECAMFDWVAAGRAAIS